MTTCINGVRIERETNFNEFLKVLRREETPAYLPFYEHFASPGFMASRIPEIAKAKGLRYWARHGGMKVPQNGWHLSDISRP